MASVTLSVTLDDGTTYTNHLTGKDSDAGWMVNKVVNMASWDLERHPNELREPATR